MNTYTPDAPRSFKIFAFVSACATLAGCGSMSREHIGFQQPTFDFVAYFEGHRKASGWFSDRFGNVRRHFCGDFVGTLRPDGIFELDEKLVYSDGVIESRLWKVSISDTGEFTAESDSLVGLAEGQIVGNRLNMKYDMNVLIAPEKVWKLSMDDYMFLQPDGSLHNSTLVKKFGIRIGSVSTQYSRPVSAEHAEAGSCEQAIEPSVAAAS